MDTRVARLTASLMIAFAWGVSLNQIRADLIPGGSFEAPPNAPALTPPWTGMGSVGTAVNGMGGVWSGTHGNQFAVLTTWQSNADDSSGLIPSPYGSNIGGLNVGSAAPVDALEAFLGYSSPGPLFSAAASQGSAMRTNFTVAVPSALEFNLLFLTNETFRGGGQDFAFYSLDGGLPIFMGFSTSANVAVPANVLFGFQETPTWKTISLNLAPGNHSIAMGIVDFSDTVFSSALLVDNVRLNVIPETAHLAYLAAAVGAGVFIVRMRKRKPLESGQVALAI